ncbi:uncharacterized protein [Typha angustifolia]|uniref:uncharacterized protein isoform X2 n=1 Tax=Typha angustifolia TaxID=59011 RepID=UPI003C2D9FA0
MVSILANLSEEVNTHSLDPEIMELLSRSRSQEEEIVLLRKKIADACFNELRLLNEKHILERKLSELRMAFDEKQGDAVSGTLKELTQKKNHLEENMKLANDLKVVEEEVYIFTSSLLSLLAEYDVRPSLINASTIAVGAKRLYQHMQLKIRASNVSFDDTDHVYGNQPGNASRSNQPIATSSRSQPPHSFVETKLSNFDQYTHFPNDPHINPMYNHTRFIQDYDMDLKDVNIPPNSDTHYPFINDKPRESLSAVNKYGPADTFEDNIGEGAYRRSSADPQLLVNQASSNDGEISLPSIEGFQIDGEAKPGFRLQACGFPINGTTLCIFQWVRLLPNGTEQYIEGASLPEYVVTADDVDTLLAVDCTPMDDNGRQGELVRQYANYQNKIICDPEMQHEINTYISTGRAIFDLSLLVDSSDGWEPTILILKRSSYLIKVKRTERVVVEEKYSHDLCIKIPYGSSTQFVLTCSDGTSLPFCTDGNSQEYITEQDIKLRDIIVLTMRIFQNKALDGKRKGKA